MLSFKQIGVSAGTDKVTHHGYDRFYPRFLDGLRDMSGAMLEIGIDKYRSLKLWQDYFPHAFIYGIDIGAEFMDHRSRVFKADQSSESDLAMVQTLIDKPVHFIIDDGSHIPEHQILTFNHYFRYLLEPGGVYIVEDIETSYWNKKSIYGYPTNYGYKHQSSFIERVKPLVDSINREFLNEAASAAVKVACGSINPATVDMISTMTFGQNCVIFVKKTAAEAEYTGRKYRFSDKVD